MGKRYYDYVKRFSVNLKKRIAAISTGDLNRIMDRQVSSWDALYQQIGGKCQSPFTQEKHNCIKSIIPDDVVSILDVGCGGGPLLAELKQMGQYEIEGLDLSPEAVRYVKEHVGVPARVGSVLDMNEIGDSSFDLVICSEVTEHLTDPDLPACYKELCRVAKKYVLLTNPYKEDLRYHQVQCLHCFSSIHAAGHIQQVDEAFQRHYFQPYTDAVEFYYSGRREKRIVYFSSFVRNCGRNLLYRDGMICLQCERPIEKCSWPLWLRVLGKTYATGQRLLRSVGVYEPANLATLATLSKQAVSKRV